MNIYFYSKNELGVEKIKENLANEVSELFSLPKNEILIDFAREINERFFQYDICIFMDYSLKNQKDWANKFEMLKKSLQELLDDKESKLKIQIIAQENLSPKYFEPDKAPSKTERKTIEDTLSVANDSNDDMFVASEPNYNFDSVILPSTVKSKVQEAIDAVSLRKIIFDEWGLSEIEPHPSSAINFFGAPGTGKSMAAEAVAKQLGMKIIKIKYAEIGSKYHGVTEKNIKSAFDSARKQNALLFFDEADSLLSSRLSSTSSSSDVAINLQRSQVLTCLDDFEGIVIFTTNMVETYDEAFLSRLISVEFTKPDVEAREAIWKLHILPREGRKLNLPLADDINCNELANKYDFVGRDIKKAVISVATKAASKKAHGTDYTIHQSDVLESCEEVLATLKVGKGSTAPEVRIEDPMSKIVKGAMQKKDKNTISMKSVTDKKFTSK